MKAMKNILMLVMFLALAGCGKKASKESEVLLADFEFAGEPVVENVQEERADSYLSAVKDEISAHWKVKQLRQKLEEEVRAGAALALKSDLDQAQSTWDKAYDIEKKFRAEYNKVSGENPFNDEPGPAVKNPGYGEAISVFAVELNKAAEDHFMNGVEGDWKKRMENYYDMVDMDLPSVLKIYGKAKRQGLRTP